MFLVNATIWVEGITDRLYFKRMLEIYQSDLPEGEPRYQLDRHFVFVEYGGAAITHFTWLADEENGVNVDRLCGRSFVIADHDGASKDERAQKLAEKLGDRFYRLPCREVENLLTPAVIEGVVRGYEGPAAELNVPAQEDYRDEYLGQFIEERVLGATPRRRSYQGESGTLKNKIRFCEKAVALMNGPEALGDDAQALAKALYEFIAGQNT